VTAFYGKLGRLPLEVSLAFVRQGAAQVAQLMPPAPQWTVPASLEEFDLHAIDGKTVKHVEHRLKATRAVRGKLQGAKLQVAQDMRSGLALAINAHEDADCNEVRLTSGLLEQIHRQRQEQREGGLVAALRPILWTSDRQYSDLSCPRLFMQQGGHFLIRHNRTLSFQADPLRPAQEGTDRRGRRWAQDWGWVGKKGRADRLYVRRITLFRPGEDDVILLTDLLDETRYPAVDLLETYLQRWGIERMFQQVTEVFDLRHLIGTTPRAAIFQSALCFVLYNILQVLRGYVAADGQLAVREVSGEKLFDDVRRELAAWALLAEPAATIEQLFPAPDAAELRRQFRHLLRWRPLWRKSKPRTRPSQRGRTIHVKGGRSSVYKLLEAEKQRQKRQKHKVARC
jgi:DDE family transposase